MKSLSKKRFYSLLIFSLVLLFNPTVNVIDLLPDFVGWLILAKLFEKASYSAPYFEEARVGFIKLAFINLAKIPALFLIIFAKGQNTLDNDVFALVSFVFAVAEAVFTIKAAKDLFSGLFHLGERSSAVALISPFSLGKRKKRHITPDNIKEYTYFFFICKAIISFLPDMFLLTRISKKTGQLLTISKHYPTVLLLSQLLGLIVGIVWLLRTVSYIKAVRCEGLFDEALISVANANSLAKLETKIKIRSIALALSLICVASIFTIELAFDNFNGINLLPHFIYGALILIAFSRLKNYCKTEKLTFISGGLFSLFSIAAYVFSIRFLSNYNYSDIATNKSAESAYSLVIILSGIELFFLIAFFIFMARALRSFILKNTGLSPDSDRYFKMEKEYHKALIKRCYIMTGVGILSAATKFINLLFKQTVKQISTNRPDIFKPTVTSSSVPWFNLVVTLTALAYIGYTFYFASTLKEEVKMKYSEE